MVLDQQSIGAGDKRGTRLTFRINTMLAEGPPNAVHPNGPKYFVVCESILSLHVSQRSQLAMYRERKLTRASRDNSERLLGAAEPLARVCMIH